jgi:deferrochelatase/peroxidase EfeB
MQHAFVTIAIPFGAARADAVEAVLAEMGDPACEDDVRQRLEKVQIVHFMSASVVRDTGAARAHLVLELTADGGEAEAIGAVAAALHPWLSRAVAAAVPGAATGAADLARYLARYDRRLGQGWLAAWGLGARAVGLPFCGTPGMTVRRIRREAALAGRVGKMDSVLFGNRAPLQKLQEVRHRLWAEDAAKWAFVAEPAPMLEPAPQPPAIGQLDPVLASASNVLAAGMALLSLLWPFLALVLLLLWAVLGWVPAMMLTNIGWVAAAWIVIGLIAALVLTASLGLAAAAIIVAYLRYLERTDPVEDRTPDAAKVASLMAKESIFAQNLLPTISTLKPGRLRRLALRFAFRLIAQHNPQVSRPGFLGKMGMIHFARWVVLPGTNKLLFWSNHDGSWASYVETFIQQEGDGVNSIWSNTQGFPRTQVLFDLGAHDGDRLRRWARRQQYRVAFWYTAYPDLTLERIRLNAAIRQGIASAVTDADAANWLACFGSQRRPMTALESDDIPTLLFGGRRHLRHCTCLVLELGPDAAQCRAWLRTIAPEITFGYERGLHRALAVAFSAAGLAKLGMDPDDLATFAPAFQNGMASPGRSRALGDVEANAPNRWLWGNERHPADAFLAVYAADATALDALLNRHREAAASYGVRLTRALATQPLPERGLPKEPFGFLDGISNPVPAGTPRARDPRLTDQVIAAGEFVLGYPDSSGYLPPTPLVDSIRDPGHALADAIPSEERDRLQFATDGAPVPRDFGRDGTYLVVREIAQDVGAFNHYVDDQACRLAAENHWTDAADAQRRGILEELIAAKMVGRWRNGGSLVRHPHHPAAAAESDNDFLFGRDDPDALRCPLGAHIRRANPRDSFDPGSAAQLAITNRHRILRVGRVYAPGEGEQPGLVFMCLNADIERQFEFVQQTWLLGRSFHGLADECDPVLAHGAGERVFTIPTCQGPLRLAGLPDFASVRGGGYFFMPGRRAIRFLAEEPARR